MRAPVPARLNALLYLTGFAGLGALLLLIGGALFYRSLLHYQINYNEGWNAYTTARVLDGLPLYPDRSSRLVNNYPPLSFYITALLAKLTGSVLAAGRAIAWCAYIACAALIGCILRVMSAGRAAAWLGALFFAAALATRCDLYVGMFDPQLLGQALMLGGLLLLLARPGLGGTIGAAALVVAGGFVKHSLIALPISITLWLLLYRRRQALTWLLAGAGFAAAGLAISLAAFGHGFIAGLLLPRQTSWAEALRKLLRWLLPLELPCVLATLPLIGGGPFPAFVGLFIAVSLGAAFLGAAPLATNYNMIFELLAAVSLGLGLLAGGAGLRVAGGWVATACAACLWITALLLATAETSSPQRWLAVQRARDADARAAVALIRAAPGPALCGTLLLCFEAGKPLLFDPLNFGQIPGENQSSLRTDVNNKAFGIIQLDPENLYFTQATVAAIQANYRELLDHPGLLSPLP